MAILREIAEAQHREPDGVTLNSALVAAAPLAFVAARYKKQGFDVKVVVAGTRLPRPQRDPGRR